MSVHDSEAWQVHNESAFPAEAHDLPTDVEQIERAIGMESETWVGNCWGVACIIFEVFRDRFPADARPVYGHYRGRIARQSAWMDATGHSGLCRHGWIDLRDGDVYDPTRWAFLSHEPSIYVGAPDGHDEGGNALRGATEPPRPAFDPEDVVHVPVSLTTAVWLQREYHTPAADGRLSRRQVMHVANLALQRVPAGVVEDLYRGIVAAGLEGFIPIDNKRKVLQ